MSYMQRTNHPDSLFRIPNNCSNTERLRWSNNYSHSRAQPLRVVRMSVTRQSLEWMRWELARVASPLRSRIMKLTESARRSDKKERGRVLPCCRFLEPFPSERRHDARKSAILSSCRRSLFRQVPIIVRQTAPSEVRKHHGLLGTPGGEIANRSSPASCYICASRGANPFPFPFSLQVELRRHVPSTTRVIPPRRT